MTRRDLQQQAQELQKQQSQDMARSFLDNVQQRVQEIENKKNELSRELRKIEELQKKNLDGPQLEKPDKFVADQINQVLFKIAEAAARALGENPNSRLKQDKENKIWKEAGTEFHIQVALEGRLATLAKSDIDKITNQKSLEKQLELSPRSAKLLMDKMADRGFIEMNKDKTFDFTQRGIEHLDSLRDIIPGRYRFRFEKSVDPGRDKDQDKPGGTKSRIDVYIEDTLLAKYHERDWKTTGGSALQKKSVKEMDDHKKHLKKKLNIELETQESISWTPHMRGKLKGLTIKWPGEDKELSDRSIEKIGRQVAEGLDAIEKGVAIKNHLEYIGQIEEFMNWLSNSKHMNESAIQAVNERSDRLNKESDKLLSEKGIQKDFEATEKDQGLLERVTNLNRFDSMSIGFNRAALENISQSVDKTKQIEQDIEKIKADLKQTDRLYRKQLENNFMETEALAKYQQQEAQLNKEIEHKEAQGRMMKDYLNEVLVAQARECNAAVEEAQRLHKDDERTRKEAEAFREWWNEIWEQIKRIEEERLKQGW
jgi:hypothetical protein